MNAVEVVVTSWRRPRNIPAIVRAVRAQTVPVTLTLIDASESWRYRPSHRGFDRVYRVRNAGSWNRWNLCGFYDHRYTWVLDDDLAPPPHAVESLLRAANQLGDWFAILGFHGRTWGSDGIQLVDNCAEMTEAQWIVRSYFVKTADIPFGLSFRHECGLDAQPQHDDYTMAAGLKQHTGCGCFVVPKVEREWTALSEDHAISQGDSYRNDLSSVQDAINRTLTGAQFFRAPREAGPMSAQRIIAEIQGDPDCYPWSLSPEAGEFMAAFIRMTGVKRVAELGTWRGMTTLRLAEAVGEGGSVVTVDNRDNTKGRLARYQHAARIRHFIQDSRVPLKSPLDMLFIDTGHEYGQTVAEVESHWPMLREGGFIFFDDPASHLGVREALANLSARGIVRFEILPTLVKRGNVSPNGLAMARKL